MKKKLRFLYIGIIITGILLIFLTFYLLKATSPAFAWGMGLGSALVVLGLGFLIVSLSEEAQSEKGKEVNHNTDRNPGISYREKSGYLVCKIMNILLCIYLLILKSMGVDPIILIIGIALVLIQYFLDLFLQIYFACRKH